MADLSKVIQIVFESVDNVGSGIASAGKGMEDFAGNVGDATQPLLDFTKAILAMDASAAALAIVIGTKAVQEANKMEDALAGVGKQLKDTDPPLADARKSIEDLALKYGESGITVAGSMEGFLAAGNDLATSASLVETATKLMIGGNLDAVKSTETITKSLAGFAIPANEAAAGATKIADVLNKLADISSGKPDELADGFSRLAPTAQAAGLSMEETGAVVAVLVDKFGSGEIAATGMKSGLLTLLDPAKGAAEELDRLGINTKDAAGEQRKAWEIMEDLAAATGKQTANQQLQSAAIIFGKEHAGTMNALLSDWGKTQSYVTQQLDATTGAVGSLDREMAVKMALMSTHISRTTEAWRQFNNSLGDEIKGKGELNGLVNAWGRLGIAARDALKSDALDPLFAALSEHFTAIAKYIDGVALALPQALEGLDWSPVLRALGEVETGFGSLFTGLDLTKPEDLHIAMQGVVDMMGRFVEVTGGIVEGLKPLFSIIGSLVSGFASLSPEVQTAVGYILGIGTTINLVMGPIGAIGGAIGAFGGLMTTAGAAAGGLVLAIGAFLVYDVTKLIQIGSALGEIRDQATLQAEAAGNIAEKNERLKDVYGELSTQTGYTIKSATDLQKALADGKITTTEVDAAFNKFQATVFTTGGAMEDDMIPSQQQLDREQRKSLLTVDEITAQYNLLAGDVLPKVGEQTKKQTELTAANAAGVTEMVFRNGQWVAASAELKTKMDAEAVAAKAAADATAKKAKETEALNKVTTEFMLGWEKIQSAERVSIFEIKSKVDIAGIEADAKRTVAAYDSMNQSFKSTETVLTKLFDLWGGLKTNQDKAKVSDWIEKEFKIREQLAKSQGDMIAAEIQRMNAQTALLEKGGTEVKISSEGLEPDLESFMFRIIDKVRVQVAGSYQQFLLGAGA